MIALLLPVALMILLIDYLINRDIFSPATMFTLLWSFICLLASLRLFDFMGYADEAVQVILCGMVAFAVGCSLAGGRIRQPLYEGVRKNDKPKGKLHLNMRFLYLVLALVCVGSLLSLSYSLTAYSAGASVSDVRMSLLGYSSKEVISNPLVEAYIMYFCGPAKTALMPIALMFMIKKRHLKFVAIVFLCIVSGIVSSGGRIVILYAIIELLALMKYYRSSISERAKRGFVVASTVGIIAIVAITTLRGNDILRSAYAYFAIPVALLQNYINLIDASGFQTYGAAGLYPLFYILNALSSFLDTDFDFLNKLVYYVGLPQNTWVGGIFPTGVYNAFCSLFYFFYMDFRTIGVVLFSFVYGLVSGSVYRRAILCKDENSFLWYLLILYSIFGSFIIWQLGNTKFFVSALIVFLAQFGGRVRIRAPKKQARYRGLRTRSD